MRINSSKLRSRKQTAREIYALARRYNRDLAAFKNYTLEQFYNLVNSIPFGMDEDHYSPIPGEHWEVIPRPAYLLNPELFPVLDCKKKAILLASFMQMQGLKYALASMSEHTGDPHHLFILLWTDRGWLPVDATKEDDYLFKPKPELIHGEIFH